MSQITTHILDISRGAPAQNVPITLSYLVDNKWQVISSNNTNDDGRIANLCKPGVMQAAGTYLMHFDTSSYFKSINESIFYPWVDVVFNLATYGQHYHVPLLLPPFGYSTYRGS